MAAFDTYAPFDSGAGANVTEDTWRKFARHFLASGVLAGVDNELECYGDSSGRQVKVKTGQAWVRGHWGEVTSEKTIPISANASGNPRIDRVVVRADFVANTVSIEVVEGTPAVSPSAPALTQSATRWEVSLAQVAVANGATSIAAGDVTDERTLVGNVGVNGFTMGAAIDMGGNPIRNAPVEVNTQTDSYTLVLADAGKVIEMNKATAVNLTVPPNSSVAYPIGTLIEVWAMGAGAVTLVAGAGVTLRTPETLVLDGQYATAVLRKRATDEWAVEGRLVTA